MSDDYDVQIWEEVKIEEFLGHEEAFKTIEKAFDLYEQDLIKFKKEYSERKNVVISRKHLYYFRIKYKYKCIEKC